MKTLFNNRDLHYAKKEFGSEFVENFQLNEEFIEYCMLLSGKFSDKLEDILSGKIEVIERVKSDLEKTPNFVITPCYSDKDLSLFERFGVRNFTLFQDNCGANTITLLVNKAISLSMVKDEFNFITNVLGKKVSFLIDSKISSRKSAQILSFLKEEGVGFFRLRWRGKSDTIRKLLLIKDFGCFSVNISNLNSNLGISDRKTGRRVASIAILNPFRTEIDSISRGVSHYVGGEYPIYQYNFTTWNVDLISYSNQESEYVESRLKLVEDFNVHAKNYFDIVSSSEYSKELKDREISIL